MISSSEDVIPLSHVHKHLPPAMPRPHVSTLVRWSIRGVGTPPIKLETLKIGGRRLTSVEAIGRFIAALSVREGPAPVTVSARKVAIQAAEAELDAEGVN